MATAILGWGSLMWDDPRPFKNWHDEWQNDGPEIKLEFSRVSESRLGALTLVIDETNGSRCRVSYAISKRKHFEDVVADLRCREGCDIRGIGHLHISDTASSEQSPAHQAINDWGSAKRLDAVVWTALSSNFYSKVRKKFTVETALEYLKELCPEGKVKAAEYIWRAPEFVKTSLRDAVQVAPWF